MLLYLNNSGHRWLDTDKTQMQFILVLPDGTRKLRIADYWESCGNFATTAYRYQGKRFKAFAVAHDGSQMRDDKATGVNALPHIFHKH